MALSPGLNDATGTTLAGSVVATGHLLRAKIYSYRLTFESMIDL